MRYDHISIFQTAYLLLIETYKITGNFKREYKYTLGERMRTLSHDMLDLIIKTNSLPNKEKSRWISKIDLKKETLRVHFRIAFDLRIISAGRLGVVNEKMEEVGKQLGGWQKWANK